MELLSATRADGTAHQTLCAYSLGYLLDSDRSDRDSISGALLNVGMTYNLTLDTLSFTSLDNTALGPALDNVVVTDLTPTPAVVTPVPTLSEWALVLLATALGALGLRGRRGRGQ